MLWIEILTVVLPDRHRLLHQTTASGHKMIEHVTTPLADHDNTFYVNIASDADYVFRIFARLSPDTPSLKMA